MLRKVSDFSGKSLSLWESLQIELQGKYSVDRLISLGEYCRAVSFAEVAVLCLLTPLPCLVTVVAGDIVSLAPPEAGTNANGVFWSRGFLILWCFTLSFVVQLKEVLAILPMSWRRVYTISILVCGGGVSYSYFLSVVIGFPVPFVMPFTAPVWSTLFLAAFAISWGKHVRGNKEAQALIIEWLMVFTIQTSLIGLYPFLNYGFLSLQAWPKSQAAFSLLLQVIKIGAKNAISRFMRLQTDMKPEVIIFNVEVFHALFVSFCMQNASSLLTMAVIVAVDLLHMATSLREVIRMVRDVKEMGEKIDTRTPQASEGRAKHGTSMLERAIALRDDASRNRSSIKTTEFATLFESFEKLLHRNQVRPQVTSIRVVQVAKTNDKDSAKDIDPLEQQYVVKVVKLLHLTECTILVEYTEVIVPIVYCTYICKLRAELCPRMSNVHFIRCSVCSNLRCCDDFIPQPGLLPGAKGNGR